MATNTIAIVGAGIAGLSCARRLQEAGMRVTLFDKGRAAGGRLATRRLQTPHGLVQFDHGAQFFTARDAAFHAAIAPLVDRSVVLPWHGAASTDGEPRFVGAPGMSALSKALSEGLTVHTQTEVKSLEKSPQGWRVFDTSTAALGAFETVVIATPAEQARALLTPAPHLQREAADARTAPCWAGMFAFAPPWDNTIAAQRFSDHPVLDWIANDSSKPQRPDAAQCWVVHARADWSRAHLEAAQDDIAARLLSALTQAVKINHAPIIAQAHRWRYARVETTASSAFAFDPAARLGICGDWRIGPRIEDAWRSGDLLAQAILA